MSPYQLVYGIDVVFPTSLRIPVLKLLHEVEVEPNDTQIRINQMLHLQQTIEEVYSNSQTIKD